MIPGLGARGPRRPQGAASAVARKAGRAWPVQLQGDGKTRSPHNQQKGVTP